MYTPAPTPICTGSPVPRFAPIVRTIVAVVALLAMLAPAAGAQGGDAQASNPPIGGSASTGLMIADLLTEVTVPGFDPALGTLVGVDLTMAAEVDNRVIEITNESNVVSDILLTAQLDLCAQPLMPEEYSTFEICSDAGGRIAMATEVSSEVFANMIPGATDSRTEVVRVNDTATTTVLDPAALRPFVGAGDVRIGVSSKSSHKTRGAFEPDPRIETFADVSVSVAYTYIAIDLAVVDGAYEVTSAGTTTLSNVAVQHDAGGQLCSVHLLSPGQSQRCAAPGGVADGASAIATASAAMNPSVTTSSGVSAGTSASIVVEVATDGEDADEVTGPKVREGDLLTWSYVITNTGTDDLLDVVVTDDRTGPICAAAVLPAGEDFGCTHEGRATSGQNVLTAKAVGTSAAGATVSDTDPTHHIVVNRDGTPTPQLATGGGSVDADLTSAADVPLSDTPYAGIEAPRLAFTGAETTVAAVIGLSFLTLGGACMGASSRLRRRHGVDG